MQRLSGLDASFLYLETNEQLMHVCALLLIDPETMPQGYDFEDLKHRLGEITSHINVFRRRLKHVPLDIDHPVWVNDEKFDIDQHVHRFGLPSPGDRDALAELCGHLAGIPLARSRAMWEIYIIEGLDDGRIGVFLKMHHASIDGISGANVLTSMCSLAPGDPPMAAEDSHLPLGMPSDWDLLFRGLLTRALTPWRMMRLLGPAYGVVADTVTRVREGTSMAAPLRAPRTSFNGTITGHRSVAFADLPLADIKAIKNSVEGVTVNDVILSLVGGSVRRYLDERGELPDTSLLAAVPVAITDAKARGANHVTALFTKLYTNISDPMERLLALSASSTHAKAHQKAIPPTALQEWAEFAAPRMFSLAGRVISGLKVVDEGPVIHNLVTSNVPGAPVPVYFMGAKIDALYPFGPIMHGAGVNITVVSTAGVMHVGLIACAEMMRHPFDLTKQFRAELDALVEQLPEAPRKRRLGGA
ncbi:MAG: wax ester/triacylglycerol synthase family O-acyltransferase [Nocardioidaceae bacterium]|nr:wax ester/triacylglycerol synthase family O-acyltransferase [Nocardioidaceae bacterium]MCB8992953.1 wax ester/triacylglycerol synthase family O-acyltransferase [Nocardioidaceae bacterium]MCO5324969.1 wax ester/triacylglycerol synthase family O-acyltransferase [Nocardioidaceae bacterium]HMY08169.1 wax ester/triacylglycerol synthase family O-acyltransferase [Marmoricola sp.]